MLEGHMILGDYTHSSPSARVVNNVTHSFDMILLRLRDSLSVNQVYYMIMLLVYWHVLSV